MSRKVKRVPLDFDWPLNEVWEGYIYKGPNRPCPAGCDNGHTVAGQYLESIVRLLLLAGSDVATRPEEPVHPWLLNIPFGGGKKPTPDMIELTTGLAGRSPVDRVIGHDSLDVYTTSRTIIRAAGLVPYSDSEDGKGAWGICQTCFGHTGHPDDRAAIEAFERTEPPVGDGWQMWETVSEGSPISPVFSTPEELAEWLSQNNRGVDVGTTKEQWLRMIHVGSSFASFVSYGNDGPLVTGVQAISDLS